MRISKEIACVICGILHKSKLGYCKNCYSKAHHRKASRSKRYTDYYSTLLNESSTVDVSKLFTFRFSKCLELQELFVKYKFKKCSTYEDVYNTVEFLTEKYKISKISLLRVLIKFPRYRSMINCYIDDTNLTSRDLCEHWNVSQRTLCGYFVFKKKKSSKAHLKAKTIIETFLNRKLETEKEFKIGKKWVYVDEYDALANTAVEIDGAWCHDPVKDSEKDNFLLTNFGVKVIRIDSLASEQQIIDKVKELKINEAGNL